jgi:hypothetical protein
LRTFEVMLPDAESLARVAERIRAASLELETDSDRYLVRDPSGNGVLLRTATRS